MMQLNQSLRLTLGLLGMVAVGAATVSPSWAGPPGWRRVFQFLTSEAEDRREGRNGGPRPGDLCLLNPGRGEQVWSRTPVFIWQGLTTTVGVRGNDPETLLWQQTATQKAQVYTAAYGQASLSPGTYEWVFLDGDGQPLLWSPFEVVDEAAYAAHGEELAALQQELEAAEASDADIALARTTYFADHNLSSDALQEVFAVSDPSPELLELQADLVQEFCAGPSQMEPTDRQRPAGE